MRDELNRTHAVNEDKSGYTGLTVPIASQVALFYNRKTIWLDCNFKYVH